MDEKCGCCADLIGRRFERRHFLYLAAGSITLAPLQALAQTGKYEAMVLACIDPRFQQPVTEYTAGRKLTGKYSQFTIAGAAIGVVAPFFKEWHQTFWDNLGATIAMHHIGTVIAINHRDCGAARLAYGDAAVATPDAETKTHRSALAEFRKQLVERHPKLGVQTGLMALGGQLELLS